MSGGDSGELADFSMLELFRLETRSQGETLTNGLLALESNPAGGTTIEPLMRAAHSIKGAARIVEQQPAVRVAHAMEDLLERLLLSGATPGGEMIDRLLAGVDLLQALAAATAPGAPPVPPQQVEAYLAALAALTAQGGATGEDAAQGATPPGAAGAPEGGAAQARPEPPPPPAAPPADQPAASPGPPGCEVDGGATVHLDPEVMDRLLGLAGESMAESRWLGPFGERLTRLYRRQRNHQGRLAELQRLLLDGDLEGLEARLERLLSHGEVQQRQLGEGLREVSRHQGRADSLSQRLFRTVVEVRMRPFRDGAAPYQRLVRDLARELGKEARLEVAGAAVPVDREILRRIEAPLTHLVRNAVDHGLESPEARRAVGKPPQGTVRLGAGHRAGALQV